MVALLEFSLETWRTIASVVQALGVLAVLIGLIYTHKQMRIQAEQAKIQTEQAELQNEHIKVQRNIAKSEFENNLFQEYRRTIRRLPISAMVGESLSDEEFENNFADLYYYIDLSNEEVFLRFDGQITEDTWKNWRAGIESNLTRPAFARAWEEIRRRSESFEELRRLEEENFESDPADWEEI